MLGRDITSGEYHKLFGWIVILSASLLLAFWIAFAAFLPMQQAYVNWVLDDDWRWINTMGFSGSLLGVFGIIVLFQFIARKGLRDYVGFVLALTGTIFLTAILFFEAFILKGIALLEPALIDLGGSFYQQDSLRIANLFGGVCFAIGVILLSLGLHRDRVFKTWKLVLFSVGAPLFGIMLMPGNVRILGVLFYTIALIAIGIEIFKRGQSPLKKGSDPI